VNLDLAGGSATLSDLSIANPEGFSDQDMVRFDELLLALDLATLNTEVLRITSVRSVNPFLHYEMQGTRSNVDALRERFPASAAPAESAPAGSEPVIAINSIQIGGIQGRLQSDVLRQTVDVDLGDVQIPPVQGTPEQLAQQIAVPLLTQLGRNATAAFTGAMSDQVESELRARATEIQEEAGERIRQAEEAAQGAADDLRNRLGL
jgi:uncharacterized protein involved in outer membrane biogenesis